MAPEIDDKTRADAIGWHIRLRADRADDWDAFVDWLEKDPAHSGVYDAIALADLELDPILAQLPRPEPRVANDDDIRPGWFAGGRAWLGGAVAAALVALAVAPGLIDSGRYDLVTGPGERRVVALGDGGQVALNGSSRITLDRDDPRFASLDGGEAAFTIRHDPDAPFTLELGDDRVQDVGTMFNVIRDADGVTVEVAEGEVLYNPMRDAIALKAGQTLHDPAGAGRVAVSTKEPTAIGAWRDGRLDYRAAPISAVAADLSRNLGTRVTVAPAIAARPFTGTIQIDRDQERMFARVGTLLDVDARRAGGGWTIGPRGRAPR